MPLVPPTLALAASSYFSGFDCPAGCPAGLLDSGPLPAPSVTVTQRAAPCKCHGEGAAPEGFVEGRCVAVRCAPYLQVWVPGDVVGGWSAPTPPRVTAGVTGSLSHGDYCHVLTCKVRVRWLKQLMSSQHLFYSKWWYRWLRVRLQ